MEVRIIRGYKLKLWKERLSLSSDFIEQVDVLGMNLIHGVYPGEKEVTVVAFIKMKDRSLRPTVFRMTSEQLESISERVDI